MAKIRSEMQTQRALNKLVRLIKRKFTGHPPLVIGIHTGGAWVAYEICRQLDWTKPATLDISLYRDDFETYGLKRSGKTEGLPAELNGEQILLVDDVLFTGRTIRAALNVLFDYGRPGQIDLAILFDREGRELPITSTFLGESLGADGMRQCKLLGPKPLVLVTPDN